MHRLRATKNHRSYPVTQYPLRGRAWAVDEGILSGVHEFQDRMRSLLNVVVGIVWFARKHEKLAPLW